MSGGSITFLVIAICLVPIAGAFGAMDAALQRVSKARVEEMRRRVADGLTTTFATEFTDTATLTEALKPDVLAAYSRPTTGTKFLITPNG